MDLVRIGELDNLINRLNGVLRKLKDRKAKLEREVFAAKGAQSRLETAAASARNRVTKLLALGLRPEFLEDVIQPVLNIPDCSGIGAVVDRELSGTEDEIRTTNGQIWAADREKKQLEMEGV